MTLDRLIPRPAAAGRRPDRLASGLDRMLRRAGDPRLAVVLLLAAGGWNAASAVLSDPGVLEHPAYLALVGGVLLTGLAGVAVRLPIAWREWRVPGVVAGRGALMNRVALSSELSRTDREGLVEVVRAAGYRVRELPGRRWMLHGTRRGWARFAALGSHAALVLLIVAAAASTATGRESTFSLLPGEQALLGQPRSGFTHAVRLERFDAEFGEDGRPLRLDTSVTFLRNGSPVSAETLQVNRPAAFGGYLVHGWTYGPAVRVRITTLGGRPLADTAVPLDGERDGIPVGAIDLPAVGAAVGLALVDPESNAVAVSAVGDDGTIGRARLRPGLEERVGRLLVRLDGLDAYVTFLARRDPLLPFVVGSSGLLVGSLAVAFWLPRRRLTLREEPGSLVVLMRGDRFDDPRGELTVLVDRLRGALA